MTAVARNQSTCYHCGNACDENIYSDNKFFCCQGCKTVFEILKENNLCEYYSIDDQKAAFHQSLADQSFDYLDDEVVRKKVLLFESKGLAKVTFSIPSIHCASCIWLLENLHRINSGILKSEINFGQKKATVDFNPGIVKLSTVASTLSSIGYTPVINLEGEPAHQHSYDRLLIYKLAIAGFCFGNIMLFSFPEYLGISDQESYLRSLFSFLNLALAVPVITFSASGYFKSALKSFRQKQINIDLPIAAGLLALFCRSSYDILTNTGPGYLDSFSGLVFFLLIGRWFQNKTYESLSFDRDFKSYFPLAVSRLMGDTWKPTVIYELRKGDRIKVRNMEIVPADGLLMSDEAYFDYSFVTGESETVRTTKGNSVYAGGKLIGQPVNIIIEKETSQSHLTSLWNNSAFKKMHESGYRKIIDRAAQRFTWLVLILALGAGVFWYAHNRDEMWLVLTSVLMVACPCALALAAPFTYGTMLRAFGEHEFYLKNADVLERMAKIDAVVFDKTGTIMYGNVSEITFKGNLTPQELADVKLLTSASTHPLSVLITKSIIGESADTISGFREITGKGIQGTIANKLYKIGSGTFVHFLGESDVDHSRVFVSVNGEVRGYFSLQIKIREYIGDMIKRLGNKCVALISGDNDADRQRLASLFSVETKLLFNQDPHAKLTFIQDLQRAGKNVLMVGDGLNDAGALKQSDVGIAISDDTGIFTPACDGILAGKKLASLDKFIDLAKKASIILQTALVISFFYNAIALSFAITGHLTPLIAAILMPVSSISVVSFSSVAVKLAVRKKLTL